jgi:uncharacterized FlaG/YvyC family protein
LGYKYRIEELNSKSVSRAQGSGEQVHSLQSISAELNLLIDSVSETTEYKYNEEP